MKRILSICIALCLLVLGCVAVSCQPANPANMSVSFAETAQEYLEYIGAYLPNRSGEGGQHEEARQWIVSELKKAGYSEEQITLQSIPETTGQNVILKAQGNDPNCDAFIVVGAHFDGDGVGDNGSGTALLLATAVGLIQYRLPVTTYFVFFDEEETGLYGSETFVNGLSEKQKEAVLYMINMDAIAFGDYCNLYGGVQNKATNEITQTEIYDYACVLAKELGFRVYGTEDLDGYFAEHGEVPAPDPIGFFTNPWTPENPAPEEAIPDRLRAYSPTTIPYSDQVAFAESGIPYVYFEATSWYVPDPENPKYSYVAYSDVNDMSLGINGVIMNTEYDNLDYLNEHFPGRSLEHFQLYSPLLNKLILEPYHN